MFINLIADYGIGDPAFAEVSRYLLVVGFCASTKSTRLAIALQKWDALYNQVPKKNIGER
jgi:hypothetical protein